MPSRRPHHKTRRGCTSCKKRRIKCDEHTPECHNCTKKSLSCSLLTLVPTSRLSSSASPTPVSPSQEVARRVHVFRQSSPYSLPSTSSLSSLTSSFESCFADSPEFFRTKGKEIFHHFLTTTSTTLATHNLAEGIWKSSVPQLAIANPYLVHGILAATSLHLSELHDAPEAKETFSKIAFSQMNSAISHYSSQLSQITAENCNALFAFSTLTVVFIFMGARDDSAALLSSSSQIKEVDTSQIASQLTNISVRLLTSVRGSSKVILNPGWAWIVQGPLAQMCERNWWPKDRTVQSPPSIKDDLRLHHLETLWMAPGQPYEYAHGVLRTALNDLRDTFALVAKLTDVPTIDNNWLIWGDDLAAGTLIDRGAIFTWPVGLSQEFVTLVEQQRPEALVIVAHWAILLHRIRDLWFVDGLGCSLVATAALVLGKERRTWIEWPIHEVGLELPEGI